VAIETETESDAFTVFYSETEPQLRRALTAAVGADAGRDATAEALAYGWEHWDRVGAMDNPAGYLYRVGRSKARNRPRRNPTWCRRTPTLPNHGVSRVWCLRWRA
jgi:DNA-directed RNA polymerase specialized sigma24 family protein